MKHRVRSFGRDERGATAIEYGLIVSLIVIVVVVGVGTLGSSAGGMWSNMSAKVVSAQP